MTRTVNKGFHEFLHRIAPPRTEAESSKTLHSSIADFLRTGYGLNDFIITGSLRNGTCINGWSGYDYFAVMPTGKLKADSVATVSEIKNYLDFHLQDAEVRIQYPGIEVAVGARGTIKIIPVDFVTEANGQKIYDMPDDTGGWMRTSPDAHGAYIKTIEQRLGVGGRNLMRLMKAWKYCGGVPISSFYLELAVAKYLEHASSVVYDVDVHGAFRYLFNNEMAPIEDPMGVSGCVNPCSAHSDYMTVKTELTAAFMRAARALEARLKYNVAEAFEWWRLLYNGKFPPYYR